MTSLSVDELASMMLVLVDAIGSPTDAISFAEEEVIFGAWFVHAAFTFDA